jgi:uncharacterized protein (TIGR02688 family)
MCGEVSSEFLKKFKVPTIKGKFEKDFDLFFYEYAYCNGKDISKYKKLKKELKSRLKNRWNTTFKIDLIGTIILTDIKNHMVNLLEYNLDNAEIKVSEEVFHAMKNNNTVRGVFSIEFDKSREIFHIYNIDVWDFNSTLENWVELQNNSSYLDSILKALKYNPSNLLFREKLALIVRLIPLVQSNTNIIELTKPQLGKSYIYKECFNENTIIKGASSLTPANLFKNNANKNEMSILSNYDVLCIDEFHKGNFKDIIDELQTFMEDGYITRGSKKEHSKTSIIFFGNLPKDTYKKNYINSEENNPFKNIKGFDEAFLQRINYISPSFGMRTLNNAFFLDSESPRIPLSYLNDIFKKLRNIEFNLLDKLNISFQYEDGTQVNIRELKSINKISMGFVKLLFPKIIHKIDQGVSLDDYEIKNVNICLYLAMEGNCANGILRNSFKSFNLIWKNKLSFDINKTYLDTINYFLNYYIECLFNRVLPHRLIINDLQGKTIKIPLDTFGIEENHLEKSNINILDSIYGNGLHQNYSLNDDLKLCVANEKEIDNCIQPNYFPFIYTKSLNKNYLFGYTLNLTLFNIDYLGSGVINNTHLTCSKCSCKITHNNYNNFYENYLCPNCNHSKYTYEIFPKIFKDFKS